MTLAQATAAETTPGRGSGRFAWYRAQVGGYIGSEFFTTGFNLPIADPGFFGFGIRDAIEAAATAQHPTLQLMEFWPIATPKTAA